LGVRVRSSTDEFRGYSWRTPRPRSNSCPTRYTTTPPGRPRRSRASGRPLGSKTSGRTSLMTFSIVRTRSGRPWRFGWLNRRRSWKGCRRKSLGALGPSRGSSVTSVSDQPVSVYGDEDGREVFSEYSVGAVGSGSGLTPPDIQVAEEVVVPREVEVETRVNPLPSYPQSTR